MRKFISFDFNDLIICISLLYNTQVIIYLNTSEIKREVFILLGNFLHHLTNVFLEKDHEQSNNKL